MKQVERYARPSSVGEALALMAADPGASWLAGGTYLMAGDGRDKPASVIDLGSCLPGRVEAATGLLSIGAGTTFQELLESPIVPAALAEAARGMPNRNIRCRATVGGNVGANKSCSSLIPALLALGASVEVASPGAAGERVALPLGDWLGRPEGLVVAVSLPIEAGRLAAAGRWARTGTDLSILTAAVSLRPEGGAAKDLRIAMGGLGPRARRFPELEALLEGRPLPSAAAVAQAAAPLFNPIDDLRGSAAFKRLRAAALLGQVVERALTGRRAS